MKILLAGFFSIAVMTVSELIPGFAFEGRADRALFFMVAWLCTNELFKKQD